MTGSLSEREGGGGDSITAKQRSVEVTRRRLANPEETSKKNIQESFDLTGSSPSAATTGMLEKYAIFVFVFRIIAFAVWTGGVLYSTYRIYVEAEELIPFFVVPENNPGPLSEWLGRSWDPLDSEWNLLGFIIWTKLICYFILYKVLEQFTISFGFFELSTWMSPMVSFIMIWELINFNAAFIFYAAPVLYWIFMRFRSKIVIWILTILFIAAINSNLVRVLLQDFTFNSLHKFGIFFAWNLSRSVSFCFDVWDRPDTEKFSVKCLGNCIKYIGYVPLIPSGPLVLYHHFENKILKKDITTKGIVHFEDVILLLKRLARLLVMTCVFVLHQYILYYRPLAYTGVPVHQMSLWAVCGSIYWLGQSFSLKYKILYGIPSALCEFDGLDMYPLPCCIAYVHRYSALWKDFDRGLYLFLIRYIYIPIIQWFKEVDPLNKVNSEIKKFLASLATFGYIFVWHSISYEVFIWTALNFLGVTVERIGSAIKRKVDAVTRLDPLMWDFIIEPLVCVPLAAMSILNSSVFCGSLDMATHFSRRLWISRADNYVWVFLYFFCHAGVAVRTWPKLSSELKVQFRRRFKGS